MLHYRPSLQTHVVVVLIANTGSARVTGYGVFRRNHPILGIQISFFQRSKVNGRRFINYTANAEFKQTTNGEFSSHSLVGSFKRTQHLVNSAFSIMPVTLSRRGIFMTLAHCYKRISSPCGLELAGGCCIHKERHLPKTGLRSDLADVFPVE